MMRSMYAGVSGLKNHQTRMDVIGNNIANVNTNGFKKSRVVFQDTLYQTMRGASRPTDARGGTNPMGVGLGMTIASIDQIHTPSPAQSTGKLTDMAVDGNGYFIVENGGQLFYTRAGAFDFDVRGNLVNTANGYKVQGWMAEQNGFIDTVAATRGIDISAYKTVTPYATTEMIFSGNLDSKLLSLDAKDESDNDLFEDGEFNDKNSIVTSKEIFDSLGNKYTVYFRMYRESADNPEEWKCEISLNPDFSDIVTGSPIDLEFNTNGRRISGGIGELEITDWPSGAEDSTITINLTGLTQFNSKTTAWAEHQDGYTMGNLVSYSIGIDGTIQGVYDNGEVRDLARVALANFQNPSGLLQAGSSLYQVSNNSGDPRIGAPGDQGMGAILPGSLEMSNVDLSEEFTDMIVTQRGFQANSRLITTSDEMLQELVNLKR